MTKSDANKIYTDAKRLYDTAKYEEAIPLFDMAIDIDKTNQYALFYLGRCYQRTGDNEKAKTNYEKVIEINETSSIANDAKTYLQQVQ